MNNIVQAQNTIHRQPLEKKISTALDLIENKKYGAARSIFKSLLLENLSYNQSVEAQYWIAYSSLQLFNLDAEELFENLIAQYPYHSKVLSAYSDLGNFYFRNKNYDKAISYFEKVNFNNLNDENAIEAKFRLGYSYFTKKEFEKAMDWFGQVKGIPGKYQMAANYYTAYIAYKKNSFDQALSDLEISVQDPNYLVLSQILKANILYKKGDYFETISFINTIQKDKKNDESTSELSLLMAESYYYLGDFENALKHYKKYNAKLGMESQFKMGLAAFKLKDYNTSVLSFKALAVNKDSIGQASAYYLGFSYIAQGNKVFAIASFDQARKQTFNKKISQEATFNYAKLCFEQEKYNESIAVLKDYIVQYPKDGNYSEAQEILSESLASTNNPTEAISYIEQLKNKTPRILSAYQKVCFHRGIELYNGSKFTESIELFDKAIQTSDNDEIKVASHFWKAEALSVLKEYDKSINAYAFVFQNAIADSEYHLKSRYGIGYAYYNTKKYDKALIHFKAYVEEMKSKKIKSNFQDALLRLADLYYVSKQYESASKTYDEVIAMKSNESDYAHFQKGLIAGVNGKYDKAIDELDQVINKYPNSLYFDNAIFQKADFQLENSNYESAILNFSTIIKQYSNSGYTPYAYLKRAIAYSNLQQHNNAIADYKHILDKYPKHPVAQNAILGLQESFVASGKNENIDELVSNFKEANPNSDALVKIEFENAKSLYNDQKYLQAIEAFKNYQKTYPSNSNTQEINYYLAESYYRTGDYVNALGAFNIVSRDNESPYLNKSYARLAEMEFMNNSYNSSIQNYFLLLRNSKNKKERCSAWLGLMENYYRKNIYDSAYLYTKEILDNGNATVDAESKALLYQGKIKLAQSDSSSAMDAFINTINNAKDENGVEAQYLLASIQFQKKMYKQSLETLYDLNNNFYVYEKWRELSYLLIADNFIALQEYFQAKATLNSIIEKSKQTETVSQAKQKLDILNRLDNKVIGQEN